MPPRPGIVPGSLPADRFEYQYGDGPRCGSLDWPIIAGEAVTPADGADLSFVTRALWVGGAGNVNVDLLGGGTVIFAGIPAGTLLPIRVKRVRATSTTASSILALD